MRLVKCPGVLKGGIFLLLMLFGIMGAAQAAPLFAPAPGDSTFIASVDYRGFAEEMWTPSGILHAPMFYSISGIDSNFTPVIDYRGYADEVVSPSGTLHAKMVYVVNPSGGGSSIDTNQIITDSIKFNGSSLAKIKISHDTLYVEAKYLKLNGINDLILNSNLSDNGGHFNLRANTDWDWECTGNWYHEIDGTLQWNLSNGSSEWSLYGGSTFVFDRGHGFSPSPGDDFYIDSVSIQTAIATKGAIHDSIEANKKSKIASFLLSQSSTNAPQLITLSNDLGSITTEYVEAGTYKIKSNSLFDTLKTVYYMSPQQGGSNFILANISYISRSELKIRCYDFDVGMPSLTLLDDLLVHVPLKIEVYK